ncbi:MAG: TetR/AcrR family transcriptional regulator [Nitrospinae bacterium]|nr:TetR/AcrR family transcriptional regulator [Nitrospinota bacterium]
MKKTEDRRIQKTHKFLHEALISLILEKKYESITVQKILDRANVGRSTFYTHFQNKDELLLNGLHGLKDMLRTAQMRAPSVSAKPYERIIGFSLPMFEHAYEYRGVWKALLRSRAGLVVRQHILKILADLIRDESEKEFRKLKREDSDIPFDLFVHFLAETFMLVIGWWLNQNNPISPKKIDGIFRDLILPNLASNLY